MKKKYKLSLIVLSFLLYSQGAYTQILAGQDTGQVYFHDFVPDTSLAALIGPPFNGIGDFDLDLTGDGGIDFGLRVNWTYSPGATYFNWYLKCFGNQVMIDSTGYAAALSYMDTIDQNATWSSSDSIVMGNYFHINSTSQNLYYGPWIDTFAVDKYLGVRIFSFGDTIYGFIHICRCGPQSLMLIRDYGIDRMDVGVGEISGENNFLLYPNPSNGRFNIYSNIILSNARIEVFNSSGELVHNENITSTRNEIDLGNISQGIYVVKISDKNGYHLSKIIIVRD